MRTLHNALKSLLKYSGLDFVHSQQGENENYPFWKMSNEDTAWSALQSFSVPL